MTVSETSGAFRSLYVTLGAQAAKFVIGLGVTMVLGRLLTPADYGVVAMVGVVTGFIGTFRDGGLSVATVQSPDISNDQVSTLFWINAALGTVTALIVALASPLVGWFYRDPPLAWVVLAMAVPFVLGGFTAQPQALLQRQMRFGTIAAIEIASLVVSAGVGIAGAALGWGRWSLVSMTIVSAASAMALTFVLCAWKPSRPVRGSGVRSMMRLGGALTVTRLFDALTGSTDILLLGRLFSAATVGLYTRAQTLMLQPMSQLMPPVQNVALPILSRMAEKGDSFKPVFLDLLRLTALAASFITVFLVVGADWIVSVFLGPRWLASATLLRLLAGPAIFIPVSMLCVVSLTALGKSAALIRWGAVKNAISVIAILCGIPWGAKGLSIALSANALLVLMPILYGITATAGVARQREIWGATGTGLVTCVAGGALLLLVVGRLGLSRPQTGLPFLVLLDGLLHVLVLFGVPSCRRALKRFV